MTGMVRVVALAVVLVVVAATMNSVQAFSAGAPDTTCGNIEPVHGVQRQSTPAPYTITPGAVQVKAGQKVLVTLEAATGGSFKGFLLQARSSDSDKVVGTFFTNVHKYLNCDNGMNNAVTHSGPDVKNKVTVNWESPSDFSGDVVFKATFVRERVTFWVGVASEKVTVIKSEGNQQSTLSPQPSAPPITATTARSVSLDNGLVVNAGDTVINVIDAPSTVAENNIRVIGEDVNASISSASPSSFDSLNVDVLPSLSPTHVESSPRTHSHSANSPSSSNSNTVESFTPSSLSNPGTSLAGSFSTAPTEPEEPEIIPGSTPPQPARPTSTTRRKFGILNRRRPTAAVAAPVITTPAATTTPTTAPPIITSADLSPETQSLQRNLVNIYDTCAIAKGCFGIPAGCETNGNCNMMVTYSRVSGGYQFEIMGSTTSGYVAAGLSEDEKMGGDTVMACRALNGNVDVVMGHNTGKSNQLLSDSTQGLSNIQTLQMDGKVYCTFVRKTVTKIMDMEYNLENTRYHIMLAVGPASASALRYHDKRSVSSATVSLKQFETVQVVSDLFRTLHACLMVGAWICAASCGIIIARYFKKTWLQSQCCGIDQWFHLHRFFMGLTWGLTMAGVALIVYYLNGWTDIDPRDNPHAILGAVSTGLCFIQPFMALCRCSPDHKRRSLFNWLHWMVGNCAQILGITAIFFGFELVGAPEWTTFILVIFIAFHCIVHLILSIGQCVSDSKAENVNNIYPMKEVSGSRNPLHPTQKRLDAPGGGFRKAMLAFYMFINFVITAILILIIVVGEDMLKEWGLIFWEED